MAKRIDFHIHTISTVKDYDFTFSLNWLKKYVQEVRLDAIAITNHDYFDINNYAEVKNELNDLGCDVFPGMELSLEDGHVNIVLNHDRAEDLDKFSTWIEENIQDKSISVNEYLENFPYWKDAIYIFELGKSNSLAVPEKLSNVCAVGGVSNQLSFQRIFNSTSELVPVLFSDAHATDFDSEPSRSDISLLKEKNTFIQIDKTDFKEIRNAIVDRSKVSVNSENLHNVIDINNVRCSTGINLIVGKRGTGKTHFLKDIRKIYPDEDMYTISQFETAKADEYLEEQREKQGQNALSRWKEK